MRSASSCRAPARTARSASARSRPPAASPSRRTSVGAACRHAAERDRQRRRRPGAAAARRSPRGSPTLPQHPYLDRRTRGPSARADDGRASSSASSPRCASTSGVDFSQYRDTTIKRRTARRMLLRGFSVAGRVRAVPRAGPRRGRGALSRRPDQRHQLLPRSGDVRGPEARGLSGDRQAASADGPPIRVWVPGCSTGQEAYSIAIALLEFLDDAPGRSAPIQIFATDLGDPASLDKARAGVYPESIEAEVSPERLRRFFVKEDRTTGSRRACATCCVFARQNVTVDPPFSRVDLVTCRNVLIYMSPPLQERLLPVFHFALESRRLPGARAGRNRRARSAICSSSSNRAHKIYRKQGRRRSRPQLTFMADEWLAGTPAHAAGAASQPPADFQREADRLMLGRYAPPSVLVNERLRDPAVPRPHGAVSRGARRASRRPTSCAWPRKGCSWSCAAP